LNPPPWRASRARRSDTAPKPSNPSLASPPSLNEEIDPAAQQFLMPPEEGNEGGDDQPCDLRELEQPARYPRLLAFVQGSRFEFVAGAFVLLSVAWLAFQIDYMARGWLVKAPKLFVYVDILFFVGFVIEIVLRIAVFGVKGFFCGPLKYACWFDFGLVVIQLLDIMEEMFEVGETQAQWIPMLRILRLFRILRLVRIFKIFPDLRLLIVSVAQSIQPLVWVFALIGSITAAFAILITVVVTDYKTQYGIEEWQKKDEEEQNLHLYFGSISRSILSLYGTISGGRDWGESAVPLDKFISPYVVYIFVLYTFFVIFAMMNVITSQFVDQTLEASAKDRRDHMVTNLMDAFTKNPSSDDETPRRSVFTGMVTEADFMGNLSHPSMKSFLKDLYKREDVKADEIRKSRLFEMLDDDGSGEVTRDELVLGCVRLTGSATSLDLAVLKLDVEHLRRDVRVMVDMHMAEGRLEGRPNRTSSM